MKASEAYHKMIKLQAPSFWKDSNSKVDETKTLIEMFNTWMNLFENNPDMIVRSIMRYNVNRDFNCL